MRIKRSKGLQLSYQLISHHFRFKQSYMLVTGESWYEGLPHQEQLQPTYMHTFCLQICALAFHPTGSILSSADEDGNIMTWDLGEAKRLQTGMKHKGAVWSLSYSSGAGSLLASGRVKLLPSCLLLQENAKDLGP